MNRMRVGILGLGRSGYGIHASWLVRDGERYQIAAVADVSPECREQAAAELGARTFGTYRELLDDRSLRLDVIVNALPSHLHVGATIEALQAGYHVICEKPLATTVAEFDRMVQAADEGGRKLLPFQNSRFQPAFEQLQRVVESGVLGEIIHARLSFSGFARRWDWQCRRAFCGGNLLNTGPHPLDQAIVLFGERDPKVFARLVSRNAFGDAEDFATVTLWDHGAPTIEVMTSSYMAYPQGDIYNISATRGGLSGNLQDLKWRYFLPEAAPAHEPDTGWAPNRAFCSEQLDWLEGSWRLDAKTGVTQLSHKRFYEHAYNVLRKNAPPQITLAQVRRQIAVLEEAHRQNPALT